MSREELRESFESWMMSDTKLPDLLERTSGAPGILRDYANQETEIQWRACVEFAGKQLPNKKTEDWIKDLEENCDTAMFRDLDIKLHRESCPEIIYREGSPHIYVKGDLTLQKMKALVNWMEKHNDE
jgi:hypothetical protein